MVRSCNRDERQVIHDAAPSHVVPNSFGRCSCLVLIARHIVAKNGEWGGGFGRDVIRLLKFLERCATAVVYVGRGSTCLLPLHVIYKFVESAAGVNKFFFV